MQLFKFAVLTTLLSLLILPSRMVLADIQQVPVTADRTSLVATVNIENAKIISQNGNTFKIGFDITNGQGVQTDVKYGVLLSQRGTNFVSDQVVYDEALTLAENSTLHREITYTAPAILSGSYELVLNSSNSNGFPFSVSYLGSVSLTSSSGGVLIDPNTCYLQINEDKAGTHYALTKNIDIRSSETLAITCTAQNQTNGSITITPTFETRHFSQFGTITSQTSGTVMPIQFTGKEQKTFSVQVPKVNTPGFYSFKMTAAGIASNSIYAQYIVSGITATVQNLTLDKNQYDPGETGKILLVWTSNAGNYERTGTGKETPEPITIKATVASKNGTACAAPIEQVLVRDQMQPQTAVPFSVTASCIDPKVSVALLDAKGTILDQKTFGFVSVAAAGPIRQTKAIIVVVALLVLAAAGLILSRKHKQQQNDALPN